MEEHVDGFGGFFEAFYDRIAICDFARHFPHAKPFSRVHIFCSVIENDKTFDAQALRKNLGEAGEGGIFPGVAGNQATENDAAVKVHAIEDGVHNLPADVFEIDIDAIRSGGDELGFPAGMLVVDGVVETEIVFNPLTFFIRAGNADDMAAMDFADLSGNTTGGAGGGGNYESFTGLRLGDFQQAEIGGEAVDAEGAEEIHVGDKGNGGKLLKSAGFPAGNVDEFLKSGKADDFIALFVIGMEGFNDFGDAEGAHNLAELNGGHVLGNVRHPDAHGGVDGKVFDACESLGLFEGGKGRFGELEDVGSDESLRVGGEFPLAIGSRHEERIAKIG